MTTYRPRTRTVEAVQLTATNAAEVAEAVGGLVNDDGTVTFTVFDEQHTARPTDYVFTQPAGGPWPSEDFEHDFEEVPEGPTARERLTAIELRLTAAGL